MLAWLAESRQNSTYVKFWCKSTKKSPFLRTFARVFNSICEMESFEEQLRKDLHQLYLMGAAMQLKRMGYHMTKMNWYEEYVDCFIR